MREGGSRTALAARQARVMASDRSLVRACQG
jgi:hypothetical protein